MIQHLMILLADRRRAMTERGASAVEYGLLIAGIAALVVAAAFLLGSTVADAFLDTNTATDGAADAVNAGKRIVGKRIVG